jgi:hypothetical protein
MSPKPPPDAEQLLDIVDILASLVRSAHMKAALHSIEPNPHLVFWCVIYGNLLDIVVLDWCKLFGSDNEAHQPTHWKNIVPTSGHAAFRRKLFSHLGIEKDRWNSYWDEMKKYRDNWAAHDNAKKRKIVLNFPTLEIAIESSYFYYNYVVGELMRLHQIEQRPPDLRSYCVAFTQQTKEVAQTALAATANIRERVS